jgi:hypothetical protein
LITAVAKSWRMSLGAARMMHDIVIGLFVSRYEFGLRV